MNKLFKVLLLTLLISCTMSSCIKHEDFEFSGEVVGFTYCNSFGDVRDAGYYIKLDYPENIGGTISQDGATMNNVIVAFQSDRLLKDKSKISGRIFLSENYSDANCLIHPTDIDVPEAVFTEINPLK